MQHISYLTTLKTRFHTTSKNKTPRYRSGILVFQMLLFSIQSRTHNFTKRLLCLSIIFAVANVSAQYDTQHYISPQWIADAGGPVNGQVQLVVSTNLPISIPVTVTRGDGTPITTLTVTAGTPKVYNLGASNNASTPGVTYGASQAFTALNNKSF